MNSKNLFGTDIKITDVIFDFGQVLVKFDPEYMCGKYLSDKGDVRLLSNTLFSRYYWDKLDAGTIGDEELLSDVKAKIPERLHEACEKIYYNWIYNLPEIEGMREVIALCREKGFGIYLLSNISEYFARHSDQIPILSLFDGCVFSATAGYVKPSEDIFRHITSKFALTPCKTLFVDDNAMNVSGAEKFGITSYLFDGNAKRLYSFIKSLP